MVLIRFDTRNRQRALTFLQGHYPNCIIEDAEESASAVLDLVEGDVFRIPDPSAHGGSIYPSKNWPDNKENQKAAIATLQEFHNTTLASKGGSHER